MDRYRSLGYITGEEFSILVGLGEILPRAKAIMGHPSYAVHDILHRVMTTKTDGGWRCYTDERRENAGYMRYTGGRICLFVLRSRPIDYDRSVGRGGCIDPDPDPSCLGNLVGDGSFSFQTFLVRLERSIATCLHTRAAQISKGHQSLTTDTRQLCDSGVRCVPQKALLQWGHSPITLRAAEGHCVGLAVISGFSGCASTGG